MPRALAKIGDLIIAETEVWETVEDNIYQSKILRSSSTQTGQHFVPGRAMLHTGILI
ncbi:hypothetical protein AWENTII_007347 [Aspergillus wentii]